MLGAQTKGSFSRTKSAKSRYLKKYSTNLFKKKYHREWSVIFSRVLSTFGGVDPDISGQKDSCSSYFFRA